MTSLFAAVRPRQDVLVGALTESRFAASLEDVVTGTAPDAYGDADKFFTATYPSTGLRALLNEALGRLSGGNPTAASVIRLETSLGGGKTHNLIALYHAARGRLSRDRVAEFMDAALLPAEPIPQIGVFVGTSTGATTFPAIDGVSPRTVWGYLALQIGGREAYAHVRVDDEKLTAPGSSALKRVFGSKPTLIMIDEIARYYTTARGHRVGSSTLAQQTSAFLMALMEAVDSLPNAVLVITTTGVTDAFGEDTEMVLKAIEEARSLIARKELVLHPSVEADLPKILARRLFEEIPAGTASEVAEAYARAADRAYAVGLDLPQRMTGAGWATAISRTYPFHPSLIQVLDKRLSTIPNFQRTRGALRLLARAIRRLWDTRPENTQLLHVHHIDLADAILAEELSSRLDRAEYEPVIRADIATQPGGTPAHAEEVDARMGGHYARRLATTIYLYSLTRDVPGVQVAELYGAVLEPSDDPNLLQRALDQLEQTAWYLHADIRGLRFSTEASLVKLIQEAEGEISTTEARRQATKILAEQFRDSALKVKRHWEDAKVPDNADDAWLVIMHWDDFGDARGVAAGHGVPAKIRELWERTPSGGVREFRNRLVFLAPTAGTHEAMVRAVRKHLALESLRRNSDVLAQLSDGKREELKEKAKESQLLARVAVCNHVNLLYVPRGNGLEAVELDIATQASVKPNQTDAILERLAAMDKTLSAGDKPLDPVYVRTKLGQVLNSRQTTMELVRAFARRADLKMVLDRAQIVNLLQAGVRNGVWDYHDPERGDEGWATRDRLATAVRLGEDTFIWPPGSAPAPAEQACPFCGQVHPGRGCSGGDGPGPKPDPAERAFRGTGAAGAAFTSARAAAAEAGRHQLHELIIEIDHIGTGAGVELTRLHTMVSATRPATEVTYDIDLRVELSKPGQTAAVQFHGLASDYMPLREAVKQLLQPRQATLKATLRATFVEPLELSGDAVGDLARIANDTGPTKCTITLITEDT